MKKINQLAAIAAAALVAGSSAHAVPTLTISDGTTTIVVTDNMAGDIAAAPGIVTWNGTIGNFIINLDSGITKPNLGGVNNPEMDLQFGATSGGSGGTITLTFTDIGFNYVGGIIDSWGGTTLGTANNSILVNGSVITSQGPVSGAFSGVSTGIANLNDLTDSLSLVVSITHGAGGTIIRDQTGAPVAVQNGVITTGNKHLTSVPDGGATLMLLGAGITALGFMRRKVASKA